MMRLVLIMRYVGLMLVVNAAFMLVCLAMAVHNHDGGEIPLLTGALITGLVGIFPVVFVPSDTRISNHEGYAIVVFSWLAVCFFGMIPYILWGGEFDFSAAWFEAVSGYTTTGATILDNVEALPKSLLLWRAFTHWIGGLGVVVFVLVIIPSLGRAQMTLTRFEVSAIARQDFHYRTRVLLRVMALTYLGISGLIIGLLWLVGLPTFDSVAVGFSTVATGGFAVTNLSIASYNNRWAELVIIGGMTLASIHFGLIYSLISGHAKSFFRSPIVRFFLLFSLGATLLIAIDLSSHYASWLHGLRHAAFQVMSVLSTTGFATTETTDWPTLALLVIFVICIVGGCSGSTAGGIKMDRLVIALAAVRATILRQQHPKAVIPVQIGRIRIEPATINAALIYIFLYITVVLGSAIVLAFEGNGLRTSVIASASCMSSVGAAFGALGSFQSYSEMSVLARLVLSLVMLLGRLEIFGLLLIFFKSSWQK